MKTRLVPRPLLMGCLAAGAAAALFGACSTTYETVESTPIPFNGKSLGPCSGNASKIIPAKDCNTACPGAQAQALCVGHAYTECVCYVGAATCDSGCCSSPYWSPEWCDGSVAMRDPTEFGSARADGGGWEECDAEVGYLLCNGTCYATFACELPDGYTLLEDAGPDGASDGGAPPDAGLDGRAESGTDGARLEAAAETGSEGGIESGADSRADTGGRDANGEAGGDGETLDASEGGGDARSEASLDGGPPSD